MEESPAQPTGTTPASKSARWNIVSVFLPPGVLALGLLLTSGSSGTGDYAGRLGSGVVLLILLATSCVVGAFAAVVALVRGERLRWLSLLGLLGNCAIILPIAGLFLRG